MVDRDLLHDRIIEEATREFTSKGVRAVRMDDIARQLGISKRTLYETFSNKEDLLLECVVRAEAKREENMGKFYSDPNYNSIEVVLEHYRQMMRAASMINPNYLVEIGHYKRVLNFFDESKRQHRDQALLFMKRGVDEGFFRPDVNYDIMLSMSDSVIDNLVQKKLYERYDVSTLFHNVFFMFFRGICTPKGLKIIDSLLTETATESETTNK